VGLNSLKSLNLTNVYPNNNKNNNNNNKVKSKPLELFELAGKNGKNQLLQKKFSYFSMDQFSSLYGENIFFPLKTSSDKLKLKYKTKKKKKLMSRLEPLCRRTYLTILKRAWLANFKMV
jgi:hypothetical protein